MELGKAAITGAAGTIGIVVREALRDEARRLVLIDRVLVRTERPHEDVHTVDLRDASARRSALAGADGVLHLGGVPDEAPLPDLVEANVLGTHHVPEAARHARIERVVLASSDRVTGFYPTGHPTGPGEPVRPDGLYGVSKVAVEALGRLYADKFGLSVVCPRIGSFETTPSEPRRLATWLSPHDAVGYVRAALTAPPTTRFASVYAASANTRRFWELPDPAVLDHVPVDDAERYREHVPGADLPADPAAPPAGPFALPEFTLRHLDP
ncbi:NAD-dependent epimerase/dehydratase family protein [Streptomyces buecherae]|uniref:NAD-dependent epimerase/dehydratase family protein n=1 Tax=Streptomyces buecherae TaxID=2763006 RepID=UPI001E575E4D|nr:NAD(P)-dependent oxidoreductase [Streptomyces buecherae]